MKIIYKDCISWNKSLIVIRNLTRSCIKYIERQPICNSLNVNINENKNGGKKNIYENNINVDNCIYRLYFMEQIAITLVQIYRNATSSLNVDID